MLPSNLSAIVEIRALQKRFRAPDEASHLVIDIPAFALPRGAQLALHGRSGSGKTTFLHLIAGILAPDSGTIQVGDHVVTDLPESKRDRLRATTLGYIFQTFNLLQGYTCLENVLLGMSFGPGPNPQLAASLLHRVGLQDRMHHYPKQLSAGQQQRVAVARALANHPKLVLADEPSGNLDPHNAQESVQLIRETCREQGAALLLVSHDREVLSMFECTQDFHQLNRALTSAKPKS